MTHHNNITNNSKSGKQEFNIDEVRNIPEEKLNEEQSKGLWTYRREQDLKMQQKQGFLPAGLDIQALAKGGKDAKEAAKNFKPAKEDKAVVEESGATTTPVAAEEDKDFGDKIKDDFVSSFKGKKQ